MAPALISACSQYIPKTPRIPIFDFWKTQDGYQVEH